MASYVRNPQTIPDDSPDGSTVRQAVADQNNEAINDLFVNLNTHSNNEDGRTHAEIDLAINDFEDNYIPVMEQLRDETEGYRDDAAQSAADAEASNQASLANKNESAQSASDADGSATTASEQAAIATNAADDAVATLQNVIDEGDAQIARVVSEGDTQVARVVVEGSSYQTQINELQDVTKQGAVLIVPSNYTYVGDEPDTVTEDVNLPDLIVANTRYVLTNPFGDMVLCNVKAQILGSTGIWGTANWLYASSGTGTNGDYATDGVIVQTGNGYVAGSANNSGGSANNGSNISTVQCRVLVEPIKLTGGNQ